MLRRSTACSTARSKAESWTVLRASATSATSSRVRTVIGSTSGTSTSSPSGVSRMSSTASGRRRSAISLACSVSDCSGRVIDRDTSQVSTTATPRASTARAPNQTRRFSAADSSSAARSTISAWRLSW